jgi:hypothetical protein
MAQRIRLAEVTAMRITFYVGLLLISLVAPLGAADKSGATSGGKSLDDQLLDDLDSELLPTTKKVAPAAKPGDAAEPGATKPKPSGLDEKLLEEIDGEDIGLGPEPDPLTRVGRNMRKSQSLITEHDTSKRTQELQKRILADLDELLQQTRKQCQGGGSNKPPSQASKPASGSPMGNKPAEGDPANKPSRDSTDRLAKAGKTDVEDQQDLDELVKQVWGHLPDKVRSQMQNVSAENFLPKYEKLIEEYYRRLAEEQSR